MKNFLIAVIVFLPAFVGTYFALSFAVPEFANPEIANSDQFFLENLRYMFPAKILVSFPVGCFLALAPGFYRKWNSTK